MVEANPPVVAAAVAEANPPVVAAAVAEANPPVVAAAMAEVGPMPYASVDVQSGEDDEQAIFSHRANLFRRSKTNMVWDQIGMGCVKICMHHFLHLEELHLIDCNGVFKQGIDVLRNDFVPLRLMTIQNNRLF